MDSPTALFDSYEQDFQQLIKSVQDRLDGEGKDGSVVYLLTERMGVRTEQRKAALRRVDMELDEADEMVSQMEIECQGIPQSLRQTYQARLRTAKSELASHKKLSKDVSSQLARADLLSHRASPSPEDGSSDDPYGATNDRSRLLAGTSMLEEGTRRLQESQRLALETENVGGDILRNLHQQREQIVNSRDRLREADSSIDKASKTLKRMIIRMYQQRVVTGAIIAVLILLIIIIVWEKYFS